MRRGPREEPWGQRHWAARVLCGPLVEGHCFGGTAEERHTAQTEWRAAGVGAPLQRPQGRKVKAYTERGGEGYSPGLGHQGLRHVQSQGATYLDAVLHLCVLGLLGGLGTPFLRIMNVQSCGGSSQQ